MGAMQVLGRPERLPEFPPHSLRRILRRLDLATKGPAFPAAAFIAAVVRDSLSPTLYSFFSDSARRAISAGCVYPASSRSAIWHEAPAIFFDSALKASFALMTTSTFKSLALLLFCPREVR